MEPLPLCQSNVLLSIISSVNGTDTSPTSGSHPANLKHVILNPEVAVARTLQDPTDPECPRDELLAKEEVAHFHAVTNEPRCKNGKPEPLAGLDALVCEDLWDGEEGLDTQASVA